MKTKTVIRAMIDELNKQYDHCENQMRKEKNVSIRIIIGRKQENLRSQISILEWTIEK